MDEFLTEFEENFHGDLSRTSWKKSKQSLRELVEKTWNVWRFFLRINGVMFQVFFRNHRELSWNYHESQVKYLTHESNLGSTFTLQPSKSLPHSVRMSSLYQSSGGPLIRYTSICLYQLTIVLNKYLQSYLFRCLLLVALFACHVY